MGFDERERAGFERLLDIAEVHDPELCQPHDDLKAVYRQAEIAHETMRALVASDWQPDAQDPTLLHPAPDTRASWVDRADAPCVVSEALAREIVALEYGGQAKRLTDLARLSLSFRAAEKLADAVTSQMAAAGLEVALLKNKFAHPTPMGYSSISAIVSGQSHPKKEAPPFEMT